MIVYRIGEFRTPWEHPRVVRAVEQCADEFGIVKVMERHQLTRSHWHYKRDGVSGTLEATWDDTKNLLYVSVHENRAGTDEWAKKMAPEFAKQLALWLNGRARLVKT